MKVYEGGFGGGGGGGGGGAPNAQGAAPSARTGGLRGFAQRAAAAVRRVVARVRGR